MTQHEKEKALAKVGDRVKALRDLYEELAEQLQGELSAVKRARLEKRLERVETQLKREEQTRWLILTDQLAPREPLPQHANPSDQLSLFQQ
jgi:two-component sensor histidine kinase